LRRRRAINQGRTSDAERVADGFHREPAFGSFHDGSCNVGFFASVASSASFSISTSWMPVLENKSDLKNTSGQTFQIAWLATNVDDPAGLLLLYLPRYKFFDESKSTQPKSIGRALCVHERH
jgi:hypothetical protein